MIVILRDISELDSVLEMVLTQLPCLIILSINLYTYNLLNIYIYIFIFVLLYIVFIIILIYIIIIIISFPATSLSFFAKTVNN